MEANFSLQDKVIVVTGGTGVLGGAFIEGIAVGGNISDAVVQPKQDVFQLNFQALQEVMQLNLMGTVIPSKVFGKEIKNGSGSIVNISSVVSQLAITKVLGYSMAKSAIDSYTQWFALELANRFDDTIRMNSITPGCFLTEQKHYSQIPMEV